MKQYKKRLLYSIVSLVLAFLLAVGGIFAWFLKSDISGVDGFVLEIVNLTGSISDIIDINSSTGQTDNPASFYPGEEIIETLTLINRTDSWMKINLKVVAVGIKYNGGSTLGLIEPVVMSNGEEAAPYSGSELTLSDFVAPVTNTCKLIVYPLIDKPSTYSLFHYITAAQLANEQEKSNSEYNMLPTNQITGLTVYSTISRSFSVSSTVYAYLTTEGDVYLKGGYNLDLKLLIYFDPLAYSTATYTDTNNNLITIKEKSSNPYFNQNVRVVLGADLISVDEEDLPSI